MPPALFSGTALDDPTVTGDLAETDGLRGYDAVHLASALRAAVDLLITEDLELIHAARRHGRPIIDARS